MSLHSTFGFLALQYVIDASPGQLHCHIANKMPAAASIKILEKSEAIQNLGSEQRLVSPW